MTAAEKKDYSEALLACSLPHRAISACPLAFGEVGVKERVKSVLHYKKPLVWVIAAALIASVAVGVFFLTDPIPEPKVSVWTLTDESFNRNNITGMNVTYGNVSLDIDDAEYMAEFFTVMDGLALGEPLGDEVVPRSVWDTTLLITLHTNQFEEFYVCFNAELDRIWMLRNPIDYTAETITSPPIFLEDCPVYEVLETAALRAFIGECLVTFSKDFSMIYGEVTDGGIKEGWQFISDMDKDGISETFDIGYGFTSGVFTFTITGVENEKQQYFGYFHGPHGNISFVEHEDGHIQLRWVKNTDESEKFFDVAIVNGSITLLPTDGSDEYGFGSFIPYW